MPSPAVWLLVAPELGQASAFSTNADCAEDVHAEVRLLRLWTRNGPYRVLLPALRSKSVSAKCSRRKSLLLDTTIPKKLTDLKIRHHR